MIPARAWFVPCLTVAILIALCARARAADLPAGFTCKHVRLYVWLYGEDAAEKEAKRKGATSHQINEARKCLRQH